jgi:hypothetical protein
VPLWACERREGMEVAVRLGHASNASWHRRAATYAEQLSDKRRCSGCGQWLGGEPVTCVASGRRVGTLPEVMAYCGTCAEVAVGGALARPR